MARRDASRLASWHAITMQITESELQFRTLESFWKHAGSKCPGWGLTQNAHRTYQVPEGTSTTL